MVTITKVSEDAHFRKMLTAQEAAEILNIGRSTIYQMIKEKEIPSVRIGRSVRIRQQALEKFIESNTEKIGGLQ